jgi:hypothetical protein
MNIEIMYMEILGTEVIANETYSPKINVVTLEGDKIKKYDSISFSSHEIQDIYSNTGLNDLDLLLQSKIKGMESIEITPEEALEKHPECREKILHLLRDKKLNDFFDSI